MRQRVTERECAAEGFSEQRDPAAAGDARDLGVQVRDERVHRPRFIPQPRRRDGEPPLEAGDLAVEQFPGAVDTRNQYEVILHWRLLTVDSRLSRYGTLRRVTPAQAGRVTWTV